MLGRISGRRRSWAGPRAGAAADMVKVARDTMLDSRQTFDGQLRLFVARLRLPNSSAWYGLGCSELAEKLLSCHAALTMLCRWDPMSTRAHDWMCSEIASRKGRGPRMTLREVTERFIDFWPKASGAGGPVRRLVDGVPYRFPCLRSWAIFVANRFVWQELRSAEAFLALPDSGAKPSDVFEFEADREK